MPLEEVLLLVTIIAVVFAIIWWLDRRVKSHGTLFSGSPTLRLRMLALVLGFLFGVMFIIAVAVGRLFLLFLVVSIALVAYGLGWDGLMKSIRTRRGKTTDQLQTNDDDMLELGQDLIEEWIQVVKDPVRKSAEFNLNMVLRGVQVHRIGALMRELEHLPPGYVFTEKDLRYLLWNFRMAWSILEHEIGDLISITLKECMEIYNGSIIGEPIDIEKLRDIADPTRWIEMKDSKARSNHSRLSLSHQLMGRSVSKARDVYEYKDESLHMAIIRDENLVELIKESLE